MPWSVAWFERLMIASVVVGLIGVLVIWQGMSQVGLLALGIAALLLVVNFGLMLLLIWLIARRRIGWLRYLLAALFALGLYNALRTLPEELRSQTVDGGLNLVRLALQGLGLVLIFTGNARPWFAVPRVTGLWPPSPPAGTP
jgi:hypothetical protein